MYIIFEKDPGVWSVGYFDSNGKWIHASNHVSKDKARECVILLNILKFPNISQDSLTINELIQFLESTIPTSTIKPKLCRLKNILKFLSNNYIYTNQITEGIFRSVKNSGQITWLLYLQTLVDLKTHKLQTENRIIEI